MARSTTSPAATKQLFYYKFTTNKANTTCHNCFQCKSILTFVFFNWRYSPAGQDSWPNWTELFPSYIFFIFIFLWIFGNVWSLWNGSGSSIESCRHFFKHPQPLWVKVFPSWTRLLAELDKPSLNPCSKDSHRLSLLQGFPLCDHGNHNRQVWRPSWSTPGKS